MRLPNKVIPYEESTLAKFPVVLSIIRERDIHPVKLYHKVSTKVEDVGEFMEVLDCLYALGKIELLEDREVLHYVEGDTLR